MKRKAGAKLASLALACVALSAPVNPASAAAKHAAQTPPKAAGNEISGVKIGMDRDDAHAVLTAQGAVGADKDAAHDKEAMENKGKQGDPDAARPEVWMLKGTPYEKVAFATGEDDKILWVTGFARPGQGVPFARLGNLARAAASSQTFAVWNVISPSGSYREIARGRDGKALTVTLLPLKSANPNGAFSPQIIPKTLPQAEIKSQK